MPTLPFCAAAAAACPEQPEGEQRSSSQRETDPEEGGTVFQQVC